MKLLLTYLILGFLTGAPIEEKKITHTISGKVTTAGSYCGGVAPTEEMLQRVQARRPMSGFVIYVKKGTENRLTSPIIDSTYTNSNGEYSFELPKGEYVLIQKNQLDKAIFETYKTSKWIQVDTECMKSWWKKGLATIKVENENIDSLNFHFQKRCFVPEAIPCLRYTGPYPP